MNKGRNVRVAAGEGQSGSYDIRYHEHSSLYQTTRSEMILITHIIIAAYLEGMRDEVLMREDTDKTNYRRHKREFAVLFGFKKTNEHEHYNQSQEIPEDIERGIP